MALRDLSEDTGFHLRIPLCNRCLHRRHRLPGEDGEALTCAVRGNIPLSLLSCEEDDCERFEEDEAQARLFDGLL